MNIRTRVPLLLLLLCFAVSCERDNPPAYPPASPPPASTPVNSSESRDESSEKPQPKEAQPAPNQRPASGPATKAPARVDRPAQTQPAPTVAARVESDEVERAPRTTATTQTVPAGTSITVVMSNEVSTATSKEGDTFSASLAEPLVVNGHVVADRGDKTVGRVEEVISPGRVKGRAQLKLVLTELMTGNRTYKTKTEPFVAIAVDNKERDAAIIAGGAGVGAAIGAITGGKKGAAIGAIIGGGGGTATVLATPGQSMKIEPETKVNFVLKDNVRLPITREKAD
jgi:hypothetical protein